ALLQRTTDIAAASRELTDAEQKSVHQRNIRLERKLVALDAIAIVVHKSNTLNSITMEELSALFRGKVSRWSELDKAMTLAPVLLVREKGSGTAQYFREHVLAGPSKEESTPSPAYAASAKIVRSNEEMIECVAAEPAAIGYVGLGQALSARDSIKILKLKLMDTSPPVMPSQNATTNDYPLSRPLYLFMDRDAKSTTRQFVDFCLGSRGQELVIEQGYVSINPAS
ncbi:MAG: substrate-binding domain-containing protein, partial [Cyanobacteria bacterium]|nr:substrate-binding domain-containing protein [Cyanobacteriota bacterium]